MVASSSSTGYGVIMLVEELLAAAKHISSAIDSNTLLSLYSALATKLRSANAVAGNPNTLRTLQQEVNDAKKAIIRAQTSSEPPQEWNAATRRAIHQLGGPNYIGMGAVEILNRALLEHAINPEAAGIEIQGIQNGIAGIKSRVDNLLPYLSNLRGCPTGPVEISIDAKTTKHKPTHTQPDVAFA